MSVEQHQPTAPVWGSPPAQPPTWSTRTALAAVGIAAVLAAGGGLAIYAATGGSHDTGPGHLSGPPGFGGPGGGGPMGGPGAMPRTLHGEYVVADGKGGFSTEVTQTGVVTAAADISVSVRSDDGYSRTYTLDAGTRKPDRAVQTGDQVTVRATTPSNGAATATALLPAR